MRKPKIYSFCEAGCKWEVPHKSDLPYKFIPITKSEFEALTEYDDDAMYVVYDDEEIEIDEQLKAINKRLDALGFKEGTFVIASGSATTNVIKKQGKYVIANLTITNINGITGITLPNDFRPKEETTIIAKVSNPTQGVFDQAIPIGIYTDGTVNSYNLSNYTMIEIINSSWELA